MMVLVTIQLFSAILLFSQHGDNILNIGNINKHILP
jgi:hypothetical protein